MFFKFNDITSEGGSSNLAGQLEIAYALRYGSSSERELILKDRRVNIEANWQSYNPFERLLLCLMLLKNNKSELAEKLFKFHTNQALVTTRLQGWSSHAWRDETLIRQLEKEINYAITSDKN